MKPPLSGWPAPPGVSTAFGVTSVRTMQTGFAAELTSTYDASGTDTGYAWKRKDLVPPAFVDPDVQLTGDKAFTIDDDQTLTAGTLGWLDISDTAGGWVFTPVAACCPAGADQYTAASNGGTSGTSSSAATISGLAGAFILTTANTLFTGLVIETAGGVADAFLIEGQASVSWGVTAASLPDYLFMKTTITLVEVDSSNAFVANASASVQVNAAQRYLALAGGGFDGWTGDAYVGGAGYGVGGVKVRVVGGGRRFCLSLGVAAQTSLLPADLSCGATIQSAGAGGTYLTWEKVCCGLEVT